MNTIDNLKAKISDGEYLDLCSQMKALHHKDESKSEKHTYRVKYYIPKIIWRKGDKCKDIIVDYGLTIGHITEHTASLINRHGGLSWNNNDEEDLIISRHDLIELCDCPNCDEEEFECPNWYVRKARLVKATRID